MIYRQLGRSGLKVSQLGFGAMRLPMTGEGEQAQVNRELAIPLLRRAVELGITYFDTAIGYCNQDSQRAVGEALEGVREKLVLSTKNHYYGENEGVWWKHLEDSLERLRTSYLDIYNHHGMTWKSYSESVEPRMSKWMQKAKDQGLIRHICCSFHDTNESLVKIVETGYVDVVTVQYNMLDRSLEKGIARAHELGVGVVIMGPVGGGRLSEPSEVFTSMVPGIKRVPELALRFVLSNPNVNVALSGMSTMEQLEENVRVTQTEAALAAADQKAIDEHLVRLAKMADLYCTGCGYCMPCPQEVNISAIFQRYNYARIYELWEAARTLYAGMGKLPWDKGLPADACIQCGACEEKCPQHIAIREQLEKAHEALSQAGVK